MAIPDEVSIINVTEIPRFVGSQVTIDVMVTYQSGVLPPRTVTIPKATDSPEARREAIRADLAKVMAPSGPLRFKLTEPPKPR